MNISCATAIRSIANKPGNGRSGFNQAVYNDVRAGLVAPDLQPAIWRFSGTREYAWTCFRIGPEPDIPFSDTQFPVEAFEESVQRGIPEVRPSDWTTNPQTTQDPTPKRLSELAVGLKGAVLMGHSGTGGFPLLAALLNPEVVKGAILLEPAYCGQSFTDSEIQTLMGVPILAVFGDHLEQGYQPYLENCQTMISRVNAAGGNAQLLYPPDLGIVGNTHMLMEDKNSNQIADLIMKWIDENVDRRRVAEK